MNLPTSSMNRPIPIPASTAAARYTERPARPIGRSAAANNATSRTVEEGTEVTFTLDGKYKFTGIINARNEVAKVTALVDNPVLGDMPIEATYSNYQTFDEGVMFPLRIVQETGGFPSYDHASRHCGSMAVSIGTFEV